MDIYSKTPEQAEALANSLLSDQERSTISEAMSDALEEEMYGHAIAGITLKVLPTLPNKMLQAVHIVIAGALPHIREVLESGDEVLRPRELGVPDWSGVNMPADGFWWSGCVKSLTLDVIHEIAGETLETVHALVARVMSAEAKTSGPVSVVMAKVISEPFDEDDTDPRVPVWKMAHAATGDKSIAIQYQMINMASRALVIMIVGAIVEQSMRWQISKRKTWWRTAVTSAAARILGIR